MTTPDDLRGLLAKVSCPLPWHVNAVDGTIADCFLALSADDARAIVEVMNHADVLLEMAEAVEVYVNDRGARDAVLWQLEALHERLSE